MERYPLFYFFFYRPATPFSGGKLRERTQGISEKGVYMMFCYVVCLTVALQLFVMYIFVSED